MKTVKITQSIMLNGKLVKPGATAEVDNGLARNLVLRERAVLVDSTKPAQTKVDPKK